MNWDSRNYWSYIFENNWCIQKSAQNYWGCEVGVRRVVLTSSAILWLGAKQSDEIGQGRFILRGMKFVHKESDKVGWIVS